MNVEGLAKLSHKVIGGSLFHGEKGSVIMCENTVAVFFPANNGVGVINFLADKTGHDFPPMLEGNALEAHIPLALAIWEEALEN